MFWLDAYWTRDGFPAGMGHYGFPIERAEPRDRFPRGLRPIGDAVHQAGLGFLMWFEPERVHPGTALAKEHPAWVISPNRDGSAASTPVWVVSDDSARLLVWTHANTWKVKRIRRDPRVLVAPCDYRGRELGSRVEARARMLHSLRGISREISKWAMFNESRDAFRFGAADYRGERQYLWRGGGDRAGDHDQHGDDSTDPDRSRRPGSDL